MNLDVPIFFPLEEWEEMLPEEFETAWGRISNLPHAKIKGEEHP